MLNGKENQSTRIDRRYSLRRLSSSLDRHRFPSPDLTQSSREEERSALSAKVTRRHFSSSGDEDRSRARARARVASEQRLPAPVPSSPVDPRSPSPRSGHVPADRPRLRCVAFIEPCAIYHAHHHHHHHRHQQLPPPLAPYSNLRQPSPFSLASFHSASLFVGFSGSPARAGRGRTRARAHTGAGQGARRGQRSERGGQGG